MSTRTRVPVGRMVLVAAASLPLSLALAAGRAQAGPERCAGATACAPTDKAEALLLSGKVVQARWIAHRVLMHDAALSDADRERAFKIWSAADAKVQNAHPLDLSLQKADLALMEGDVKTAQLHARAVLSSPTVDAARSDEAKRLLADADRRRAEFAPLAAETLAQSERDFLAGRYPEAKAGLSIVDRSGVELSPEMRAVLASYQTRIVDLERSRGGAFASDAMAGVMQPGTVRRREDAPPPTPPPEPAAEQPAAQPPAEQPVEQPPPPPPPAQPSGDLIQQAWQFEAQSQLAEADRAFAESRLNEAQTKYIRLRTEYRAHLTAAQLKHVEDRITDVRMRMGQQGQPVEALIQDGKVIHDEAVATYNQHMTDAQRDLDTGDTNMARAEMANARLKLNQARNWFAEREFEDLFGRTQQLESRIAQKEQELAIRLVQDRDEEQRRRAAEQAETTRRDRDRKINELLDRARAYQNELKYREALESVNQLLFLDPINPAGLLLKDLYQAIILYRDYNEMQKEKSFEFGRNSIDNQRAAIPAPGVVNYPRDWPAISFARGDALAFQDTPENRRALAMLEDPGRRIPTVAFTDNALGDVVSFFGDITQVNVDVDWASLEVIGITRDTPVSLNLTNVSAQSMLDRVLAKLGDGGTGKADWAVRDGIVTIASDDAIRKHTALAIYDVRDLIIEIPDYDEVPTIDLQSVLQSTQGGGGGRSPFQNDQGQDNAIQTAREERLDAIIQIIQDNIDPEGWIDTGGTTGKIHRLVNQGQLIITNTPRNHREIDGFLSKLRAQRAMQINVETRFLLINQDFFEQIGFDLDVYFNANNNQLRAARAVDPTIQPSDFFRNGQLQRLAVEPFTGGGTTQVVHPRPWSIIGAQSDSLGMAAGLAPTQGIASSILGGAPALGIAGQFLDDVQVDFLIQATQADRRSVQLTAPRLTFTNGQTSNIFVATQQAFVSDLQPIVGDSAVGFDPTVNVVTEGVTLLVTGTITSDRRYVTMNVDAGVSRIDGFANQAVTAVAGGQLVNSADTQSFIQLPTVTVTRVRTTVTVPDQGSLLLGGQRLVTEFDVETGVPVLSKIPVLNRFFTNRIESKEEQTLLILMKPTILIQNEEEDRQFPGLNEQIRFGG